MPLRPSRGTSILLIPGLFTLFAGASLAADAGEPVLATPHFAFYSDFATNLNDALLVAGAARKSERPELFRSGEEQACFDGLAPSARFGWSLAVDWYAEIVSPASWNDRQQDLIRVDLAGVGGYLADDGRAQSYLGIVHGFLAAATPAYEACRWPAQDAQNRAWIEALAPGLAAHEATIASRLAALYQVEWHGLPIRVDAVETSPSVGASTILPSPAGGHVLISTASLAGDLSFETVFHEASHTLVAPWRPDPVPRALAAAAEELGVDLPRDLWHVTLFYTTGQVVRQVLEAAGHPGYTPYLFAFDRFGRGEWGRCRDALEKVWPAYLAGERTLDEAAADLLRALSSSPGYEPGDIMATLLEQLGGMSPNQHDPLVAPNTSRARISRHRTRLPGAQGIPNRRRFSHSALRLMPRISAALPWWPRV